MPRVHTLLALLSLSDLPQEMIFCILEFLDAQSIHNTSITCGWLNVVCDDFCKLMGMKIYTTNQVILTYTQKNEKFVSNNRQKIHRTRYPHKIIRVYDPIGNIFPCGTGNVLGERFMYYTNRYWFRDECGINEFIYGIDSIPDRLDLPPYYRCVIFHDQISGVMIILETKNWDMYIADGIDNVLYGIDRIKVIRDDHKEKEIFMTRYAINEPYDIEKCNSYDMFVCPTTGDCVMITMAYDYSIVGMLLREKSIEL